MGKTSTWQCPVADVEGDKTADDGEDVRVGVYVMCFAGGDVYYYGGGVAVAGVGYRGNRVGGRRNGDEPFCMVPASISIRALRVSGWAIQGALCGG
jgi:hypothetical protein